jgi:GNAT superfamily N-acetyltransferase
MHITQHWTGQDGTALTLRPVRADDASRLDVLIRSLAPRDRRWRFHGAVNALTPQRLRAMATPAPAQQIALVVLAHAPGRDALIADARCVVDDSGEAAEFGLMVAPAWRRLGIGERLTIALRDAAAGAGLRWLHGSVLADNAPMLALMQRCGFLCTLNHRDAGLVGIELQLDHEPALLCTPPVAPSRWRWSLLPRSPSPSF